MDTSSQTTLSPLPQFESRLAPSDDFEIPGHSHHAGLIAITTSNHASSFRLDEFGLHILSDIVWPDRKPVTINRRRPLANFWQPLPDTLTYCNLPQMKYRLRQQLNVFRVVHANNDESLNTSSPRPPCSNVKNSLAKSDNSCAAW
jgi:hypothetical protein